MLLGANFIGKPIDVVVRSSARSHLWNGRNNSILYSTLLQQVLGMSLN